MKFNYYFNIIKLVVIYIQLIGNVTEVGGEDFMRRNFNSKEFNDKYYYDGELGAIYNKEETIFRVWSPEAKSLELLLYRDGNTESLIERDLLHKKVMDFGK